MTHKRNLYEPKLTSTLSYLATLLTPIFLLGLGLRILLTPLFYNVEYRMPYFPPDQYGMTNEDRLHWAPFAIDYLLNDADISYLGELTFEDGEPLYNERELSHMQDVKVVTKGALQSLVCGSGVTGRAREPGPGSGNGGRLFVRD